MTMNKVLLLLIVASGFLLIFYANTDLFRWKSKQIVDRPIAASLATIRIIDDNGNVNEDSSRSRISSSSSYRNVVVDNENVDIDQLFRKQQYRRGHTKQLDNNSNRQNNLNFNDNNENNVVIRDNDDVDTNNVIGNDYGGDWNRDNVVMNDDPNVDFIKKKENWQRFDAEDVDDNSNNNKADWHRRFPALTNIDDDVDNRAGQLSQSRDGGGGSGRDDDHIINDDSIDYTSIKRVKYVPRVNETEYNIFIIYTKQNYLLKMKFELFIKSLLKYSSVKLHLHIISDGKSEHFAEENLLRLINQYKRIVFYTLYSVDDCAAKISDISRIMMPYFSSHPGSYYSDALFYLSLGLHRIVDKNMRRAILIDCDIVFRTDVKRLFDEFDRFSPDNLFGLAPELTPVYRHILYQYRAKNPYTDLGNPYYLATVHSSIGKHHKKHNSNSGNSGISSSSNNNSGSRKHGYPGLNSGVVLIDFERVRKSKMYADLLRAEHVERIAKKYEFKGHLGDQDYYTLIGYEYPSLIYRMDCVWNRQLCTWWKEHGYSDIFDTFFQCEGRIHLYHGNCNSRVPE